MSVEQRVREALERDGSRHEVDVQALYAATRARLDEREDRAALRRRGAARGGLLAAAAVVTIAGVGVVAPVVTDRLFADSSDASAGPVDSAFSCPVQRTTDLTTSDDDSFLPELDARARPTRGSDDAPRHVVVVDGDRATLRLGNADSTLASVTTFEKVDGAYRRLEVTKCTNDAVVGSATAPLVDPGLASTEPGLRARDVDPDAVLVLDRLTYDVAGLSKRITGYAYGCEARVCVDAGSAPGQLVLARVRGNGVPDDISSVLADPDDVVGVDPAQALVAIYDRTGQLADVTWGDRSGARTAVDPVPDESWTGRFYLVLAPAATLQDVQVTTTDGESTTYDAEDLRQ